MVDLTLVLYNSAKHLPKLVESFAQPSALPTGTALLVYDNASTDGSLELLESLLTSHRPTFSEVRIARGTANLGFGRGNNAAAAQGKGEFVFLLNHDTELTRDCLGHLLTMARSDDAKVAVWEARQSPYEHPKIYDPVTLETPWVSGACVLVRRSAFEEIGGFDPDFFMYGEDVDLSWRLRDKGYVLRYVPRAVVTHHTYSNPNEVKPTQFVGSVRANLALRTRFGTWQDIAAGVGRQTLLLADPRQQIPRQRTAVAKGMWEWARNFSAWRKGSSRQVPHAFPAWDYSATRLGAFWDIREGVALSAKNGAALPKVSVLIRTMGRVRLLSDALKTLVNQTYPNVEAVIIQDGAATLEAFLGPWRDRLSITYEAFGSNRGRCLAGNRAMEVARGDYFVFLDEDDLFYADHIEQLLAALLREKTKAAMSYAFELPTAYSSDPLGGVVAEGKMFTRFQTPFSYLTLLRGSYIPIHTVLFHRSLFEQCGGLDPKSALSEDWNLWVRYATRARPFATVPKTTAIYRVPSDQKAAEQRASGIYKFRDLSQTAHNELPVELTVGELLGMVDGARGKVVPMLDELISQYPFLADPAARIAKVAQIGLSKVAARLRRG